MSAPTPNQHSAKSSPRRLVVRPMVDGHVMKPMNVNLARISLEDQRKYRLEARLKNRQQTVLELSAIDEQSGSEENDSTLSPENLQQLSPSRSLLTSRNLSNLQQTDNNDDASGIVLALTPDRSFNLERADNSSSMSSTPPRHFEDLLVAEVSVKSTVLECTRK